MKKSLLVTAIIMAAFVGSLASGAQLGDQFNLKSSVGICTVVRILPNNMVRLETASGFRFTSDTPPDNRKCGFKLKSQLKHLNLQQLAQVRIELQRLWAKKTNKTEQRIRDAFATLNEFEHDQRIRSASLAAGVVQ